MRKHCPWCVEKLGSSGTNANVAINFEKQVFKCWRCETSGRLTTWVANKLGVPTYGLSSGGSAVLKEDSDDDDYVAKYPDGYVPLNPSKDVVRSVVLGPYVRYLKRRGVSLQLAKAFQIGVVLGPSKECWHTTGSLVFPVKDGERSGHILRDRTGVYRNSKGLRREEALYNGDALYLDSIERLYIVEGIFDALVMEGRAVATLGTSIAEKQLDRIAKFKGEVVFACDGEARRVSRASAKRLQLRGKRDAYWVNVHAGRDPGDLGYGAISALPLCC